MVTSIPKIHYYKYFFIADPALRILPTYYITYIKHSQSVAVASESSGSSIERTISEAGLQVVQVKDPSKRPKRCTTLDVFWCTSSDMGETAPGRPGFGASRRMEKDNKAMQGFSDRKKTEDPQKHAR